MKCEHNSCAASADRVATLNGKGYCDQHIAEHGIKPIFDVIKSIGWPVV